MRSHQQLFLLTLPSPWDIPKALKPGLAIVDGTMEPSINIHPSALLGVGNCLFRHRPQRATESAIGIFWGTRSPDNIFDIRDVNELKTLQGCQIDKDYLEHIVSLHTTIHPNDQFIGLFIATELVGNNAVAFDAVNAASTLAQSSNFADPDMLIGTFDVKDDTICRYFVAGTEVSANHVHNVSTGPERSVLNSMGNAQALEGSFEVTTRSLLRQIRCLKVLYDELSFLTAAVESNDCTTKGKLDALHSEISTTLQLLNRPDILATFGEDSGHNFDLCTLADELMNSMIQNEAILL